MALWVPLLAGAWSDRLRTPIGGRVPFVLAGGLPAAAALVLIGFLHSLLAVATAAAAFFIAYFVAYEPYRALYPDLVDREAIAGRAQSSQAVARGLGTGLALLGGGLLLSITRWMPFVVAALVLVTAIVAFAWLLLRGGTLGAHRLRDLRVLHGQRDDAQGQLRTGVLPVGEMRWEANIPGHEATHPIEYSAGEPGIKPDQ